MTLAGERIQALFSELTLEDQTVVPRFEILWNKAELCSSQPTPRSITSILSLAVAASVFVAIAGLSAMFWPASQTNLPMQSFASITLSVPLKTVVGKSIDGRGKSITVSHRTNRKALNRQALMMRNLAIISSWRSPTEPLLESPAGSVLRTLPKLNESVKELESFLPNNEMKELNDE